MYPYIWVVSMCGFLNMGEVKRGSCGPGWFSLLFVLVALWPGSVSASTAVDLPLESLVNRSALIVKGEVVTVEAVWQNSGSSHGEAGWEHAPGSGRIVTKVGVQVKQVWKGGAGESGVNLHGGGHLVELVTLGGRIDPIGQLVPGAPKLVVGNSYVFFLTPGPTVGGRGYLTPLGLSQGVFRIVGGSSMGDRDPLQVVRDLSGLHLIGPGSTPGGSAPYGAPRQEQPAYSLPTNPHSPSLSLEELRRWVDDVLTGRATPPLPPPSLPGGDQGPSPLSDGVSRDGGPHDFH